MLHSALREVHFFPRVLTIDADEFEINCVSDLLLIACNAQAISIPSFVTSVESASLLGDESLSEVEIPASIEQLGGFYEFQALQTIRFTSVGRLRVVKGFEGCDRLQRIEIPSSVEIIDVTAFARCSLLKYVSFSTPSRLATIAGFQECPRLDFIVIPSSVTNISGFSRCESLHMIVVNHSDFPDPYWRTVSFAADGCLKVLRGFSGCTALVAVEIPTSVTHINKDAFSGCSLLRELTFQRGSALSEIEGFSDCRLLGRIEFPRSVRRIAGFKRCHQLRVVTFPPGSQLEILDAFGGCPRLSVIRISSCPVRLVLPRVVFVEHHDECRMKRSRRLLHLGSLGLVRHLPSRWEVWPRPDDEDNVPLLPVSVFDGFNNWFDVPSIFQTKWGSPERVVV
jgi:hypothetical protein